MGLNSACGIYEGFINVSFNEKDYNKDIIKFNAVGGKMSGLIYGDRTL